MTLRTSSQYVLRMANVHRVWQELRTIRTLNGDSLTSLSQRSGVSLSYLSQLENGQREPNAVVTKKLAQALKVPVSVLMKAPADPTASAAVGAASIKTISASLVVAFELLLLLAVLGVGAR